MINITPTFLQELYNSTRGIPEGFNTNLHIPYITRNGKNITTTYKEKAYLPNPMFPVELYEYRRGSNIKLSIDGEVPSRFAETNLNKEIYRDKAMKTKVTRMIDLCRQYMTNELEQELDNEIHFFESVEEDDKKSLEYHYDLAETVKSFNDYLCIVFLNLTNILTYPNETFYEKYTKNQIRIKPDDALRMANKICKKMQEEFEEIVYENFPIRETVARITKVEKNSETVFDTDDVLLKETTIKKSKGKLSKPEKQEKK